MVIDYKVSNGVFKKVYEIFCRLLKICFNYYYLAD